MEVSVRTSGLAAWLIVAIFAVAISPPLRAEGVSFKIVMTSDQPAPGIAGATFGFPSLSNINEGGSVIFKSRLVGPGVTTSNGEALWLRDGDPFTKVARLGDQAGGLPAGVTYTLLDQADVLDSNLVSFRGQASGPGFAGEAIFTGSADAPSAKARRSVSAGDFGIISTFALGGSGRLIFTADGGPGTSGSALWQNSGGVLTRLIKPGDPAPGTSSTFGGLLGASIWLNNNDDMAVGAGAVGVGAGIWMQKSGQPLQKVVTAQDQPSGTEAGVTFASFHPFYWFDDQGRFVLQADLQGAEVTAANDEGIWAGPADALVKIVRAGDAVPGAAAGVTFDMTRWPVMGDSGRVAFHARLQGAGLDASNNIGIYGGVAGDLRQAARLGEHAPGTLDGVVFKFLDPPFWGDSDYFYFPGTVEGPGITTANSRGIWRMNPDGTVQLIVRGGDLLEVAPGDIRTISGVGTTFSARTNGHGDLLFPVSFTNGTSGLVVASVPEPGNIAAAAGLLLILRRKRKRVCLNQTASW
jgi:hypothetical protein